MAIKKKPKKTKNKSTFNLFEAFNSSINNFFGSIKGAMIHVFKKDFKTIKHFDNLVAEYLSDKQRKVILKRNYNESHIGCFFEIIQILSENRRKDTQKIKNTIKQNREEIVQNDLDLFDHTEKLVEAKKSVLKKHFKSKYGIFKSFKNFDKFSADELQKYRELKTAELKQNYDSNMHKEDIEFLKGEYKLKNTKYIEAFESIHSLCTNKKWYEKEPILYKQLTKELDINLRIANNI